MAADLAGTGADGVTEVLVAWRSLEGRRKCFPLENCADGKCKASDGL